MRYLATFLLGAFIASGSLYLVMHQQPQSPERVAATESEAGIPEESAEPSDDALAVSKERIASLEAELEAANALAAELRASMAAEEEETAEVEEPLSEDEERESTLEDIRAKLAENGMAQAQLKALTEMMYGDFINSLDLNAEEKALLREALAQSFMEQMALSQYAMQDGEIPWNEVKAWELEERGYLDDQLSEILSVDQYKSWQDYAANVEERQLDGALRTQIKNFASGLTPENFDVVMQVAVEEFRAEQYALEQSDTPFTMVENIMFQIRAMEAMRERLQEYLSPEQFAEIDNWLVMANNLLMSQIPPDAQ